MGWRLRSPYGAVRRTAPVWCRKWIGRIGRESIFNLGHDIARNTIKDIFKERGIEPAPEHGRSTNWHTFIKSHLGALDRDPLYTKAFRTLLKEAGVNIVHLPARSPNLNSHTERSIGSLRAECLCRIIPLGAKHLRDTIASYAEHYHLERNHQGLGNRLIEPNAANTNSGEGRIRRRQRVGGLLSYYYRAA